MQVHGSAPEEAKSTFIEITTEYKASKLIYSGTA